MVGRVFLHQGHLGEIVHRPKEKMLFGILNEYQI